jgi:signal transduction histidine kinase
MDWLQRLVGMTTTAAGAPPERPSTVARCEALVDAALALARAPAEDGIEPVLRIAVRGAARLAGGSAALALVDRDGRIERFAGERADGCTRDTLTRADVLGPLLAALRTAGTAVGPDELDEPAARLLAAVAPHGFLAAALGTDGLGLIVVMAAEDQPFDAELAGLLSVLGEATAATIARTRQVCELQDRSEELHRLAEHVLAARDEELRHTAHELHEGICQRLAAANVQLQALDPLLDADGTPARARLRDARVLVKQTLGELRELAQALRPSVLEDFGYLHALRWYIGRLRARSGVALSLEVEGAESRLPLPVEGALYRATEDALKRVANGHGRGPLRVRYRREGSGVHIEIAGQSPGEVDLVAMRERLRPFGGAVRVTSGPDAPPVIEVHVPAKAVAN